MQVNEISFLLKPRLVSIRVNKLEYQSQIQPITCSSWTFMPKYIFQNIIFIAVRRSEKLSLRGQESYLLATESKTLGATSGGDVVTGAKVSETSEQAAKHGQGVQQEVGSATHRPTASERLTVGRAAPNGVCEQLRHRLGTDRGRCRTCSRGDACVPKNTCRALVLRLPQTSALTDRICQNAAIHLDINSAKTQIAPINCREFDIKLLLGSPAPVSITSFKKFKKYIGFFCVTNNHGYK